MKSKYISMNFEIVLQKSNQNVLNQIIGQTRELMERVTTTLAPLTTEQNSTAASILVRPLVRPASSSNQGSNGISPKPAASALAHEVG